MLYLSTKLTNQPLMSIRSTGKIGTVLEPIINPHNLHIDGFYCDAFNAKTEQILLDMYVRDLSNKGIIIDDHANLSDPDELLRLQPVMDMNFQIIGKQVLVNKKKVGKITDYAVDRDSLFIQKFYVQPPVWQSLQQNHLTFDRVSVIEVTDTYISFSGPEEKVARAVKSRKQTLAPDYSASASEISE